MCDGPAQATIKCMLMTGSPHIDAERAFTRAARARRRAGIMRGLRRVPKACRRLAVYDPRQVRDRDAAAGRRIREIPLGAISGTLEPARAELFDDAFRPAPPRARAGSASGSPSTAARCCRRSPSSRWSDGYALRDGHHRVSVAHARGALTIDATVESFPA